MIKEDEEIPLQPSAEELSKLTFRELTKAFCKRPESQDLENRFIQVLNAHCHDALTRLHLTIDDFLANPNQETTKQALKDAILAVESGFSTAYQAARSSDEEETGVDAHELSVIYTTVFNRVISGDHPLKISHIRQLYLWREEELNALDNRDLEGETERHQGIIEGRLSILLAFAQNAHPLSESATKIYTDLLESITERIKNEESPTIYQPLTKIRDNLSQFFECRLFYDAKETEDFITSNQRQLEALLNKTDLLAPPVIDFLKIKRVREEYCLTEAAHAIALHAKTYQSNHTEDATTANKLANKLSQTIHTFFNTADFSEEKKQAFTNKLYTRIQAKNKTLSKHRGWGEVIENFLLVLSSFALIGIAPALIKFYKRTIEGDKHFGYLKTKTASLAEETLKLANAIEVDSRLKPK
jgi:hypothetical protein